jgi:hypothetical protein
MYKTTTFSSKLLRTWLEFLILALFSLDGYAAATAQGSKATQPDRKEPSKTYNRVTVAVDKGPIIVLTDDQKAKLKAAGITRTPFMDNNFNVHYFDLDGNPINLCNDQPNAAKRDPSAAADTCTLEATAQGLVMLLSGASDCGSCWKNNIVRICWKTGRKEDKFACPNTNAKKVCASNCD